jgi:hypothetical protein
MRANLNPARLKLALALDGIRPSPARAAGEAVELLIGDDTWALARVRDNSPYALREGPDLDCIAGPECETAVRVVEPPDFSARRNGRGIPYGEISAMRGTYATIALGGGCSQAAVGRTCALCRGRELTEHAGEVWPVDEVVDAVRLAFEDGDAEFVHLVLGYFPGDDAGAAVLRPYLDAIHRHFDTIVAVTMHPPADLRVIDATYAAGVDAVCYSIEAPDDDSMRRHFAGRASLAGRRRYLDALAHAARVFPAGAVWSEILIDLAPPESTAGAIAGIAALGAVPLLAASAAHETGAHAIALDDAARLGADAFAAVSRAGLPLNWVRDISTSLTPLDARHLVPGAEQAPILVQLSRNRLGALTTRSLARMRRRLRVRRVRASFDSSRL